MNGVGRLALAALAAATLAGPARAADWLQNFMQPAPEETTIGDPVELGTGWYLRGDAGAGFDTLPNFGAKPTLSGWSVDLGAGYKINNWLRVDLGLDMRKPQSFSSNSQTVNGKQIICPGGATALQTLHAGAGGATITELDGSTQTYAAGDQIGYVWDPILGTCNQQSTASMSSMAALLNGYIDLGTWGGFTPYIGAGAGVARIATNSSVNYYDNSSGALYAPTAGQWAETAGTPLTWINANGQILTASQSGSLAPPVNPNTGKLESIASPPAWNLSRNGTRYNFAWSLMAGTAYTLTRNLKLDIGFRYLNLGSVQYLPGGPSSAITAKEVHVGLRYQID